MKVKEKKVFEITISADKYDWSLINSITKRARWHSECAGRLVPVSGSRKRKYEVKYFYVITMYSRKTAIKVWGALNL